MYKIIGVRVSSGTYQGHDYRNYLIYFLEEEAKGMLCGTPCGYLKVRASDIEAISGGFCKGDGDMYNLLGMYVDAAYDRYQNVNRLWISDEPESAD